MYYTYVIQSRSDGKLYTGITFNLRKRFKEHNTDESRSTKGRGPFDLIYYEVYVDQHDAAMREKYLKSGLGKRYIRNRLQRFLSLTGQEKARPVRGRSPRATASSNRGFIALISAILIAVALLTMVTAAGFSGFFTRFNILGSEVKEQSIFLAEACVNTAILKVSQGIGNEEDYGGAETVVVGSEICDIVSVDPPGYNSWPKLIKTQASSSNAFTNLEVEVDNLGGVTVTSWEEVPNL